MSKQIENMAFVYVRKRKPYKCVCVDREEASRFYARNLRWSHTATIDPKTWIAYILNHPTERMEQIESLFDATPLPKSK